VSFAVAAEHENAEIDRRPYIGRQAVNVERLIRLDPVLPAAGADYRVNGIPPGGSGLAPAPG
jgi:hypothetical protein